jgi:hypothetical protein
LAGVVVAVEAVRLAEGLLVGGVGAVAAQVDPVWAEVFVPAGSAGQGVAVFAGAAVCTGPKPGAVRVRNTAGCLATLPGTPLPPTMPVRTSSYASRL